MRDNLIIMKYLEMQNQLRILPSHLNWLPIGVRPICQHNFGNNRMLKEPRIMLE